MANEYGLGRLGLPIDQAKCLELLSEAGDLGYLEAQYTLGSYHAQGKMGLEQNDEEAFKYEKKAAEGGHLNALHNAGCMEVENYDFVAGMRHWRLAASGGYRKSMECLILFFFEKGLLHHDDLADTLQAMYHARAEMKSEDRDDYIKQLKMTGEYREEFDW
jgi:TPR repeat protein